MSRSAPSVLGEADAAAVGKGAGKGEKLDPSQFFPTDAEKQLTCTHCGVKGHDPRTCYKIPGHEGYQAAARAHMRAESPGKDQSQSESEG